MKDGTDPLRALALCQDHAPGALSTIERDGAWWLEHGYLSADDSRALQKKVNVLCADLRPQALTLVAGFGIPDALLRAPIATAV